MGKITAKSEGPFRVIKVSGKYNQRVTIVRQIEKPSRGMVEPTPRSVHAS